MGMSHEEFQAIARNRAAHAFETDLVRYYLQVLGREDLLTDLLYQGTHAEDWASLDTLWELIGPIPPMKFQAWPRKCQPPEPTFKKLLELLRSQEPGLDVVKCLSDDWSPGYWGETGLGLVFVYKDQEVILHNRPQWSQGKPIKTILLPNGCSLGMHRARPFLLDLAGEYRMDLAADDSALYDRIESNWDFDRDGEGRWEEQELR
jgi:hypothetical protein